MNKKVTTKQDEIDVLQSLKGDTYFSQYFTDKDIDQMCENIRNDFAIESCCKFHQEAAILKAALRKGLCEQKQKLKEFAFRGIDLFKERLDEEYIAYLTEFVSMKDIINYQREKGYPLIECEIDYLVSELNKQA